MILFKPNNSGNNDALLGLIDNTKIKSSATVQFAKLSSFFTWSLWSSILVMVLNFVTSVGIISVNKIVLSDSHLQFSYPILLTSLHFAFTFIGLLVYSLYFKQFQISWIRFRDVLPLCLTFTGFVVFNNLSLRYNSLGFYQLMKVLTTPVIVILQYLLYNVVISLKTKLSLLPICVGVILATVSDISLNLTGFLYAVLGIASTSLYQLYIKTKQTELKVNSYQLLLNQAPYSAVLVFILSLLTEPITNDSGWMSYVYTTSAILFILLSCLLAFLVNLSIFLVIEKTSPLAYNVLGHLKLAVILASGFLFFHDTINIGTLIGIMSTVIGVIIYTHLQQTNSNGWENKSNTSPQTGRNTASLLNNNSNSNNDRKTITILAICALIVFSTIGVILYKAHNDTFAKNPGNTVLTWNNGDVNNIASNNVSSVEIVVAANKEQLDWLHFNIYNSYYPNLIYPLRTSIITPNQKRVFSKKSPLFLPTKSNEASVYLYWIVSNYHRKDFPDRVIFIHGHRTSWHNTEPMDSIINRLNFNRTGFYSLNYERPVLYDRSLLGEENQSSFFSTFFFTNAGYDMSLTPRLSIQRHVFNLLEKYTPQFMIEQVGPIEDIWACHCCAQFLVSSDRILNKPFEFWMELYKWSQIPEYPKNGYLISSYYSGRVFEYNWHRIFGEKNDYLIDLTQPTRLKKEFAALDGCYILHDCKSKFK